MSPARRGWRGTWQPPCSPGARLGAVSNEAPSHPQDGTVHLVYGLLEEPLQSLEAINTSGLRTGLQRVQLLKPSIPQPALPADTRTMEIRAPDVLIPGQQTTYWCYITELPDGFPRHHIVMVGGPVCAHPWRAVRGPAPRVRRPPSPCSLPTRPPPPGLLHPGFPAWTNRCLDFCIFPWDGNGWLSICLSVRLPSPLK